MKAQWVSICFAAVALTLSGASHAGSVVTSVVDGKDRPLADAVVYFVPATPIAANAGKHVVIDQIDKEFVPRVTVVQTGTAVDFPNHDNIRHQVYSFSPAKTFQLKLYSGRPSAPVVFDKTGVAVLGCNIHDHMIAWVLSVDTPWFVRSDAQGRAQLSNLPAGKYEMLVWHPGLTQPVSQGSIETSGRDSLERAIKIETGALLGADLFDDAAAHAEHHHAGS